MQGEQLTIDQEEAHVARQLEGIGRGEVVYLLAMAGAEVIGVASIGLKGRVERHIGDLGISIAREWRGVGIGSQLMQSLIDEALTLMPSIRVFTLSVFGNNQSAQRMYQRFGFREYGRLPRGILHCGEYVDHVYMYRDVG